MFAKFHSRYLQHQRFRLEKIPAYAIPNDLTQVQTPAEQGPRRFDASRARQCTAWWGSLSFGAEFPLLAESGHRSARLLRREAVVGREARKYPLLSAIWAHCAN
ncbi:hypothetical protein [Paracidovorax avenae]|uniref:hypothetical protein n=1 Tax=Paracidovorax avenae TaxID=80867 RepID=UPI001F319C3B|nr:hypothetical protein [Paracidovorax avenae]